MEQSNNKKKFRDFESDGLTKIVVTITLILIIFFVCFEGVFVKEDLLDVLKNSLKMENRTPRKDVYYIVDSKKESIIMIDKLSRKEVK